MSRYAQIVDGRVHGIFEYEKLPAFPEYIQMVEVSTGVLVEPGWLYEDGVFGESSATPVELPALVTVLAFRQRFTTEERTQIELAALDDPSATQDVRKKAAAIRSQLADLAASNYVDLKREQTRSATVALEKQGLLKKGRATVILDTAPDWMELPASVRARIDNSGRYA